MKTMLVRCSVSASDLRSIQELIEYYHSDLAQALIQHERSLQLSLHQMKLIGKDKCASENNTIQGYKDLTQSQYLNE